MTASSVGETPREMAFLGGRSVAVARAKGLVLVFGAPRLRAARCETVDHHLRLVNTLCDLHDLPPGTGALPR